MAQDKKAEQEFFSALVARGCYHVLSPRGFRVLLGHFLAALPPGARRVGEGGSGSGGFTAYLAGAGFQVAALDLSFPCLRHSRRAGPGPVTGSGWSICGDVEHLPFSDGSLDALVFSGVLHHLPALEPALAEAYRVLKPGGLLYSYDPNNRNPFFWLLRSPTSPFFSRRGRTVNERTLDPRLLTAALRQAGFRGGAEAVCGVSFGDQHYDPLFRPLVLLYNLLEPFPRWVGKEKEWGAFLLGRGCKPAPSSGPAPAGAPG